MVADNHDRRYVRLRQAVLLLLPLPALNPGFNITIGDVCFFGVLALLGLRLFFGFRPVSLFSAGIAVLVLVSVLYNAVVNPDGGDLVEGIQAFVIYAVVIPLGWNICRDLDLREIMIPLAIAGLLHATVAILQVVQPSWRLPSQPESGLGEFGQRPAGLAGNPNGLGLIQAFLLPLLVFLSLRARTHREHLLWVLGTIIVLVGGIISFSKIGLLVIPLSLVVTLFAFSGRRGGFVAVGIVAAIGICLWFSDLIFWFFDVVSYRFAFSDSFGGRLEGIEAAWNFVNEWWLVGAGAGADAFFNVDGVRIHNQFIGFAVQFGVPAALLLIVLKGTLLICGLRLLRSEFVRLMLIVFVISEICLLVHPTYWTRVYYLPTILLIASLVACTSRERSGEVEEVT